MANIFAFGKQLRDIGGHDEWRIDYNVLVRVHNRFRKKLYNPARTQTLPEGVHLGIIRPTRVTHITYEDGASQTIRDTWSADERATELANSWKGETHFELDVPQEQPLQVIAPPFGLRLSEQASSSSGLSQDEASVGLQSARR